MMRRIRVVSLLLAAGCLSETPEVSPPEAALERFILCSDDGTSREERIPTAARLRVRAEDEPSGDIATVTQALTSCSALGPQPIAVLYVTWPDPTGQIATIEEVDAAFFGADPSLRGYWDEVSYQQTSATGSVFGPYTLAHAYTCSAADLSALAADAILAADADVDFTQFARVVIVSPQGPDSGCSVLGVSQIGCSQRSSPGDGTFTASVTHILDWYMTPQDKGASLAAHELGHALGLGHANSLDFDLDAIAPVSKAGFGTSTDYGGPYTSMGSAILQKGHYDAAHKARLGWLDGRFATVEASGTFHLAPYELASPGSGELQALKIRRAPGVDEWLWIEQRAAVGPYDGTLDPLAFGGALVHLQSSATDLKSYALDLTPPTTSFRDGVLVPGAPFHDPYTGMILEAANLDENGVDVTVTYGAPTCVVTSPAVSIAPTSAITAAGAATSFTVTVTDLDAASCPTGTFQLLALRPTGWTYTYSPPTLQIAPGASATTTLSMTPAAGAAVGSSSTITARSFRYGWMGNANATIKVCGAGAPTTVTVTPASATVEAGFPQAFTVTVTSNDCAARTVTPSSSTPTGWATSIAPASLSLDPGQSGTFTVTRTAPPATAAGTYGVGVSAGGGTASASLTLTPAQTRVTTSVPGGPFKKNVALAILSTVTYGGAPVPASAPVSFFVTRPTGQTQTFSTATAANGVATLGYTPPKAGTYTVGSSVTYPAGNTVTSTQVAFSVGN